MTAFPPPDEYQRALLNPGHCFADAELRQSKARLNAWGLPVAWSGQFATVFRVENGREASAVRCFTAQVSDHQQRYAALHSHASGKRLPMLADFEYLPRGILVQGEWLPIVKMEWVEGLPLDRAVEQAVQRDDRKALRHMADQWEQMVERLHNGGVIHGDLQHDNVLVEGSALRLVDYDGVWVPALKGRGALETGHPHYQHPRRAGSDYGPHIDNFAARVILLSLRALAIDPSLWARYHSDKHLILRGDDYRAPDRSPLLLELTRSPDAELRRLTLELVRCSGGPADTVPALATNIPAPTPAPRQPPASPPPTAPAQDWRASWRAVEGEAKLAASAVAAPAAVEPALPLWQNATLERVAQWPPFLRARETLERLFGRADAAEPLSGGLAGIVLLLLGMGGGIIAALLQMTAAPWWLSTLLTATVLPLALIVSRRFEVALGAHALLLLTQALLPGGWSWSVPLYVAGSTFVSGAPLALSSRKSLSLSLVTVSILLGMLARAALGWWLWQRSVAPGVVLAELLLAVLAALLAVALGKGVRALLLLLARRQLPRL